MKLKKEITESLIIRKPELTDGLSIHNLVSNSPPLDINSIYSYLLFSKHFNLTCAVAELNQEIVGYTLAYLLPHKQDTLFIWQVAVKDDLRGSGIAGDMILDIFSRGKLPEIKYLEATISKENKSSESLFNRLSSMLNTNINRTLFFSENLFGKAPHPAEYLLSVGPIKPNSYDEI